MGSKHTEGPWEYQERSDDYTHIVRGPNNRFIVQLLQDTSGEAEANARLIASAPTQAQTIADLRARVERLKEKASAVLDYGPHGTADLDAKGATIEFSRVWRELRDELRIVDTTGRGEVEK